MLTRKIMFTLAEDDRYYREWLGLALILAGEEYHRFVGEVSPAQLKMLCQEQWEVAPTMLSDSHVEAFKEVFAQDALSYYLHNNAGK